MQRFREKAILQNEENVPLKIRVLSVYFKTIYLTLSVYISLYSKKDKKKWYRGRDLNPHGRNRLILSQLRLPFRHPGTCFKPNIGNF